MIIVVGRTIWGSTSAIWIAANEEGHVTFLNNIDKSRQFPIMMEARDAAADI